VDPIGRSFLARTHPKQFHWFGQFDSGARLNPFAHMPSAFRWQRNEWPTRKIPGVGASQPLPRLMLFTGCLAMTEAPPN
jgi:hypothetical protein